jgi:protein-disulfide isomerase
MESEIVRLTLPVNNNRHHIQGPTIAPATLLEYGDYECPYCGQVYVIIKQVQKYLGQKLRFAFRNFPLTQVHPHAQQAAEAAESSGGQNKFWEMHDCLYEHQQALDDKHLETYAALLGLDLAQFIYDMSNHVYSDRVREDFLSGILSGLNGTPTFYINGIRYNGSWDLETVLEALTSVIQKSL